MPYKNPQPIYFFQTVFFITSVLKGAVAKTWIGINRDLGQIFFKWVDSMRRKDPKKSIFFDNNKFLWYFYDIIFYFSYKFIDIFNLIRNFSH